ncbi:Mrp/NBP35 family ATP-binding protein [Pseudoclavibacter sp. CFCC 14310]|uniref:Mrp/NBP35 family ATP-binding protein n=1 Tax=Pseudoclavibacter sp. CFCC 14310 TaxID=2615180 RepID=UPI0013015A4B|nr:P-loop NTPase [Pseudoclavibacter sp. CFCC 14310]KAB1647629.1 Mrp/NBP35 family ATP-binding protein [Pseudoclavibacter sp. CFCC 14310]
MLPDQTSKRIDPALEAALSRVHDPELRRPLVDLGMIEQATLVDGHAEALVRLTITGCPASQRIEHDVIEALESVVGAGNAKVTLEVMSDEQRRALLASLRQGHRGNPFGEGTLTRVIAVTSGKGGVGKSTITANLAADLAARGLDVGVLDADVYGFSIPGQLGITTGPTKLDELMLPPIGHGVKAISIGMFVGAGKAVSWRGPMLQRTLQQFLTDVHFGDLDVLLLDLPPGTGDVALTAGQLLPNAEVVVVTTPQEAASEVAVRAGLLAGQLGQKVAGVVENMSWLQQGDERIEVFGSGGGRRAADELSQDLERPVPLLGQIPMSIPVRAGADIGQPVVLTAPEDPAAQALHALATRLVERPRGLQGRQLPLSVG